MDILYQDNRIAVCLKPPGVLSTDEPGMPPPSARTASAPSTGWTPRSAA